MEAGRATAVRGVASPTGRGLSAALSPIFPYEEKILPSKQEVLAGQGHQEGLASMTSWLKFTFSLHLNPQEQKPWEHLSAQADSSTATEL